MLTILPVVALTSNRIKYSSTKIQHKCVLVVNNVILCKDYSVILSIINSCDESPSKDENGIMRTTKADPQLHGFGLKAIHRIIRRYHGDSLIGYDLEQKRFSFIIRFPVL